MTGGPLTRQGVEHFVAMIERKRRLLKKVMVVAGTDHLSTLEGFVDLVYERIQSPAVAAAPKPVAASPPTPAPVECNGPRRKPSRNGHAKKRP